MKALFVSPHFDDVALSCGGLVGMHAAAGDQPVVVTVFTAGPGPAPVNNPLTRRMLSLAGVGRGDGDKLIEKRRAEDAAAMRELGVTSRLLPFRDASYRGMLYTNEDQLVDTVSPEDGPLREQIADAVIEIWRKTNDALVYLPLGIGNHVDHQICARLHRRLVGAGARVVHYEDIPYVLALRASERRLKSIALRDEPPPPAEPWLDAHLRGLGLQPWVVDVAAHFDRRIRAVEKYTSQVPFLFPGGAREPLVEHARYVAGGRGLGERVWGFVAS